MHSHKWSHPTIALMVLVAMTATLLVRQHRTTLQLKNAIAAERAEGGKKSYLLEEQKKLTAAQVSSTELERLRAERASVSALRAEIEKMKRRAETTARAIPATPAQDNTAHTLSDGPMAARDWRNAGNATPDAALETALWASAGGDLDALTRLLSFEPEEHDKAEAIFMQLPVALRSELGTSERLIALMVANDAPLGSAQIVDKTWFGGRSQLKILLTDEQGQSKPAQLSLRFNGTNWRFIVPERAVEKYAGQLEVPVEAR